MKNIPGTTNISKCSAGYQIEKMIDGSKKYFGYGKTLIEALMMKRLLILILIIGLITIVPVSAEKVTAKVDDKGLMYAHNYGTLGTLHTEYGWITVEDGDYNRIRVNDTIIYDTTKNTFWSPYWEVKVV